MIILSPITRYLASIAAAKMEATVSTALSPVGPYLKTLAIGIGILILAILCYSLSLISFSASLFFLLASLRAYAMAGLETALIFLLIGVLLTVISLTFLSKSYPGHSRP